MTLYTIRCVVSAAQELHYTPSHDLLYYTGTTHRLGRLVLVTKSIVYYSVTGHRKRHASVL